MYYVYSLNMAMHFIRVLTYVLNYLYYTNLFSGCINEHTIQSYIKINAAGEGRQRKFILELQVKGF